jgi:hypothetical protein
MNAENPAKARRPKIYPLVYAPSGMIGIPALTACPFGTSSLANLKAYWKKISFIIFENKRFVLCHTSSRENSSNRFCTLFIKAWEFTFKSISWS